MEKEHTFSKGDVEIGQRIRRLRKYLRMTQKELAEKVMISPSSITRLESGQIMVSLFTLIEIAKVLQVPVVCRHQKRQKTALKMANSFFLKKIFSKTFFVKTPSLNKHSFLIF